MRPRWLKLSPRRALRSEHGPKEQGMAAREFYTHTTTTYLRGA